jgi:hypothetical protein
MVWKPLVRGGRPNPVRLLSQAGENACQPLVYGDIERMTVRTEVRQTLKVNANRRLSPLPSSLCFLPQLVGTSMKGMEPHFHTPFD